MSERLVLVSDLHLGGGAETARWGPGFADEFDGDEAFPAFLEWLTSTAHRSSRLVLLGDTIDFLRVPVAGALYARNDAEAICQLEQIAAAHPKVFEALSTTAGRGIGIDIVVGNHDVELARPSVQNRLRALLAPSGESATDGDAVRFHLWSYYVPGVLYAEHGNHYSEVNSFHRPLSPVQGGRTERPLGPRLGSARRLLFPGDPGQPLFRQVAADVVANDRLARAARDEYRDRVLADYAAEIGLPVSAVRRLHELGARSAGATAVRIAKVRLTGSMSFREASWHVAAAVHGMLADAGSSVPFCVFGHTHTACHLQLNGGDGVYLNTGTWSTDMGRAVPGRRAVPHPPRRTWVEVTTSQGSDGPRSRLLRWVGAPVEIPGPTSGVSDQVVGRR